MDKICASFMNLKGCLHGTFLFILCVMMEGNLVIWLLFQVWKAKLGDVKEEDTASVEAKQK